MQWLLGPDYPVVASPRVPPSGWFPEIPSGQDTLGRVLQNEVAFRTATVQPAGPTYSPTLNGISKDAWYASMLYGDFIKFVHQAIEWENILYFLCLYFWGSETIGRDKFLFEHNDPEHERFLRAGYARIVLTVRPGFEEAFTGLVEKGPLGRDPKYFIAPLRKMSRISPGRTTPAFHPLTLDCMRGRCSFQSSGQRGTLCKR